MTKQSPTRIRLSRAKGWKMPENTVKVDRTTRWGNPFDFRGSEFCWVALSFGCRGDPAGRQKASVLAFRDWVTTPPGCRTISTEMQVKLGSGDQEINLGPKVEAGAPPSLEDIRSNLRGKNLACWCALDAPCHADVYLDLANSQDPKDA